MIDNDAYPYPTPNSKPSDCPYKAGTEEWKTWQHELRTKQYFGDGYKKQRALHTQRNAKVKETTLAARSLVQDTLDEWLGNTPPPKIKLQVTDTQFLKDPYRYIVSTDPHAYDPDYFLDYNTQTYVPRDPNIRWPKTIWDEITRHKVLQVLENNPINSRRNEREVLFIGGPHNAKIDKAPYITTTLLVPVSTRYNMISSGLSITKGLYRMVETY